MTRIRFHKRRGTALLAVLWLTAALSAIAFSIADTVRSEAERSITNQETTRAYYLARGAVERVLFLLRNDESFTGYAPSDRFASRRRMYFQEQTGDALVELISERGKLPLRSLSPSTLENMLLALGEPPASANAIATRAFSGAMAPISPSSENSPPAPAFRPALASMENVEELLLVPGITPELLYGRYSRLPDGNLVNLGGLVDLLTPYVKQDTGLDPYSVHPTMLVVRGKTRAEAMNFGEVRRRVFDPNASLAAMGGLLPGMRADLGDVFQVRATGRARMANGALSPARRTVSLLIKFIPPNPRYTWISPWTHLRWYDQTFSDVAASNTVWRNTVPQQ